MPINKNDIKSVIFDFDGVLTDNRVMVFSDGMEAVICNRSDGWGIRRLQETGLRVLILSSETNPVVDARARKLNVEVISSALDKFSTLKVWLKENSLEFGEIVYVGNDLNDLDCICESGIGISVADAHQVILERSDKVLNKIGGDGVAQEVADWLLGCDS